MESRPENQELSLDFLSQPGSSAGEAGVTVTDLTKALGAFQNAIYATVAFELNLTSVRNLTDAQRRQYALAVVGFHHSDFWTQLMPLTAIGVEVSRQASLFTAAEIDRVTLDQIFSAWEKINHAIEALRNVFAGKEQNPTLDRLIGRRGAEIAQTAIKSGQTIEIMARQSSGSELIFRTSRDGNERALNRLEEQHGTVREYPEMIVKDIMTSQPVIKVVSRRQPGELITCKCPKGLEAHYGERLKINDTITVAGVPIWTDEDSLREMPDIIDVIYLHTPDGDMIGQRPFDQFLHSRGPAA